MASQDLILFYNVENYFPADIEDSGQKPSGLYNWSPYKYSLKTNRINNVFRFIEEDYCQLPMIIGLAEIGSLDVLEDLKTNNSPLKNYEIVYQKSQDRRGLSVALLFDNSQLQLLNTEILNFQLDINNPLETRDILHTEFLMNQKMLHIFVLHLPSKREGNAKKRQRDFILIKLKETIKAITDKNESVIIMGDYNEDPTEDNIKNFCGSNLNNPFEEFLYTKKYTSFHHKSGVVFDQIIYAESLIKTELNYKTISAEIYNNIRLRNKDGRNNQYPIRTYSGSRYIGGYSDHFPVILKLQKD